MTTRGSNMDASLGERCDMLLDRMRLERMYDSQAKMFYGGYDTQEPAYSQWHYGVFCTEARIATYVGTFRYGVPIEHFVKLPFLATLILNF